VQLIAEERLDLGGLSADELAALLKAYRDGSAGLEGGDDVELGRQAGPRAGRPAPVDDERPRREHRPA
jgi:hypothetical protein